MTASLLTPDLLRAEVPQMLNEVKALDRRQLLYAAERAADVVACGADVLWVAKLPRKAETTPADIIHAIVAGLAILALRPGGVEFGGLHWCVAEHDGCGGPGEWTVPAAALSRVARGAWFTPRELAEEVTDTCLEALVYRPGPLQVADRAAWRIAPSSEILRLKIGDITVGSGVFLLAACRYLADRLVEAWFAEAAHPPQDLPPHNPMTLAARRLVMRCLYGVDIDPLSVEMSRLTLALLAPTVPVDLTGRIVCGDSLLGIVSLEQLAAGRLDPKASRIGPIVDIELLRRLTAVNAYLAEEAA